MTAVIGVVMETLPSALYKVRLDEGAMVLPAALAEEVARDALEQEEREAFALERVAEGESIVGLYPLADHRVAEFEVWRAQREPRAHPGGG